MEWVEVGRIGEVLECGKGLCWASCQAPIGGGQRQCFHSSDTLSFAEYLTFRPSTATTKGFQLNKEYPSYWNYNIRLVRNRRTEHVRHCACADVGRSDGDDIR
jgi:hypothetical protein